MSFFALTIRCLKLVSRKAIRMPTSCRRNLATKYTASRGDYISLEREMSMRRAEARASVLVQVSSEASCGELVAYCQQFGTVQGVYHYSLSKGSQHFMLVKFSEESEVERVLTDGSCYRSDERANAIRTPFLWFRASDRKRRERPADLPLAVRDGCRQIGEEELIKELQNCEDLSHQIQLLYDRISLNDLGIRLRYMVARQVEVVLNNLHANISVLPFGSSVNGFGKMGCDLDLVLNNVIQNDPSMPERRLMFHCKRWGDGGAEQWVRQLELAGEVLRVCVPGVARVVPVLHARTPIVKYTHELAGVECDLCAANMSGVHMSELLHLYGCLDPRVRPLVFAVRSWARTAALTSAHPGPWITNFPLTLLVLFFLQQDLGDGAVLPSVQYLVDKAGKEDIRITENQVNCTFLRDLNKIPTQDFTKNENSLSELFLQFFEFYSKFDFDTSALSVVSGKAINKPVHSPLYIVNPLEHNLNVSRNVSFKECDRLKLEVRNAAWCLESNLEQKKKNGWGLIELIEKKSTRAIKELVRVGNSHRLVKVADIFQETEDSSKITETREKGDDSNVKVLKDKVEFKNSQIERQVKKIKQANVSIIEEERQKILASDHTKRIRRR